MLGALSCALVWVHFRRVLAAFPLKLCLVSALTSFLALAVEFVTGSVAVVAQALPSAACRWSGFAVQTLLGANDAALLAMVALLLVPRSRRLRRRAARALLPLIAGICAIAGLVAAIPPLFGAAGTYVDAGGACWLLQDTASAPLPTHVVALLTTVVLLLVAASITGVRHVRRKRLRALLGGRPEPLFRGDSNRSGGLRSGRRRRQAVRTGLAWDDGEDEDDEDEELLVEDASADALPEDVDDIAHESILFARRMAAKRTGKVLWTWATLHVVAGLPGVVAAISAFTDAADPPEALRMLSALGRCVALAQFCALAWINIGALGETCCVGRSASIATPRAPPVAATSTKTARQSGSSSATTPLQATCVAQRQPSEAALVYGTSPIRPLHAHTPVSRSFGLSDAAAVVVVQSRGSICDEDDADGLDDNEEDDEEADDDTASVGGSVSQL